MAVDQSITRTDFVLGDVIHPPHPSRLAALLKFVRQKPLGAFGR